MSVFVPVSIAKAAGLLPAWRAQKRRVLAWGRARVHRQPWGLDLKYSSGRSWHNCPLMWKQKRGSPGLVGGPGTGSRSWTRERSDL